MQNMTMPTMPAVNTNSLEEEFTHFVKDAGFPCVGAKSALARRQIAFVKGGHIACPADDAAIVRQIQNFAARQDETSLFVSLIVMFDNAGQMDDALFEAFLWQRLQAFHAIDAVSFEWDGKVSKDPQSPQFSMSLGGKAFYVVGLHPGASRPARRFSRPAMVFNLHSQFEMLREEGIYGKLKETILKRDMAANGSINPMLAMHGERSEAQQYSGRETGADWQCPFKALDFNALDTKKLGQRHAA